MAAAKVMAMAGKSRLVVEVSDAPRSAMAPKGLKLKCVQMSG
jgi:hypothetical protein